MTNSQARIGSRAIVIGASIGGLLTARVLSDFYEEVVVVDRDHFGRGGFRKGVQQARHAHGLLAGGQRAMEALLPNITTELEARGAISADMQARCTWVNEGYALSHAATGMQGLLTSRVLLEDQVRTRVETIGNVVIHERCDALGLVVDPHGRVNCLRVAWRERDGVDEQIEAQLIVDASGRGSRLPAWLQAMGYGTPAIDEIAMGLSYTTREFVRTEADADARNLVIAATVRHPRVGVMLAQPGARWVVTLGGYLGEAAPSDLAGFHAFAARCASPVLANAIQELTPIDDARTFKYHASAWRRYDRMRRFPDGLLVLGDAICSFNPVFGQGMSVAAREAVALQACLRDGGQRGLTKRFFAAATREISIPWDIAASSDLRLPAVRGRRSVKTRVTNRYLRRYFRAAQDDDALGFAFLRVANLLAAPTTLLTPTSLMRVLRARDAAGVPVRLSHSGSIQTAAGDR